MTATKFAKPLVIGEHSFAPGDSATVQIPVGHLITHEMVEVTVHVRRGKRPGPRLLITAALHGDEINGVEVVRRLLDRKMSKLAGDLVMIPITNLPAFLARSRYLPDRRDLNRLFPGSSTGSFGARLARVLTRDIAKQCTHAIDLHTGAVNRPNIPQVRFSPEVKENEDLARVFGAPVMIAAPARAGSFREVFARKNKPMLMFEGGEAEILEPGPVRLASQGIVAVMRYLKMLPALKRERQRPDPVLCVETWWQRAPRGGLFLPSADLGAVVTEGTILGEVADPLGVAKTPIQAEKAGVVIGRARNAVIDEGDGLFHIGLTDCPSCVTDSIGAAEAELDHRLDHPVFDETLED